MGTMRKKFIETAVNSGSEVTSGGQGRVKDPARDRRLAQNREGPTGQGRVKDEKSDRRLAVNGTGKDLRSRRL